MDKQHQIQYKEWRKLVQKKQRYKIKIDEEIDKKKSRIITNKYKALNQNQLKLGEQDSGILETKLDESGILQDKKKAAEELEGFQKFYSE